MVLLMSVENTMDRARKKQENFKEYMNCKETVQNETAEMLNITRKQVREFITHKAREEVRSK